VQGTVVIVRVLQIALAHPPHNIAISAPMAIILIQEPGTANLVPA